MSLDNNLVIPISVFSCKSRNTEGVDRCKGCDWFNDHYGPYPGYRYLAEMWPEGVSSAECELTGTEFTTPEPISGCRTAPIMTVGINPNLTAYQNSVKGATWIYPNFSSLMDYAHYFRFRKTSQESMTREFVESCIVEETRVEAKQDGKVTAIEKANDNIRIDVAYDDGSGWSYRVPVDYEVLVKRPYTYSPVDVSKGDPLAARIAWPNDRTTEISRVGVGYYEQFNSIFEKFKNAGDDALKTSDVTIGDDASQGDMVACASPGWNAYFTDMARNDIVGSCVDEHQYLPGQVVYSQPSAIVFSGNSAFSMFKGFFGRWIDEIPDFETTWELLSYCRKAPVYMNYTKDGVAFKTRLVFSPHFSYSSNFARGIWIPESQFEKIKEISSEDWRFIQKHGKSAYHATLLKGDVDDYKDKLTPEVLDMITPFYCDVEGSIADVMLQEYTKGVIRLNGDGGHFVRTNASCNFCTNDVFGFTEHCPLKDD